MRALSTFWTLALLALVLLSDLVGGDIFDKLDVDHDGMLSKAEINEGLAKLEAFLEQPLPTHSSWSFLPSFSLDGFWKAFTSSTAMIIATEIGDKTFFIAAVLSMKHSRAAVFAGAITALILMTILSTAMGLVLPNLMDRRYTHILGGILFLYFGIRLLIDSQSMEAGKTSDELEEVEEELSKRRRDDDIDVESNYQAKRAKVAVWTVILQSLSLTFVAEWGDRSQIATIALAASKNPIGVTIGGCLGHSLCTGLAVVGGRMLAARISEKTVHRYGGLLFLVFGIHSLIFEE